MKNMRYYVYGFFLSLFISSLLISPITVYAEGTISNVGATVGSDAGPDAVSWANAMPIMIDAYGHYIVPTENSTANYYFTYSNNKGSTWTSVAASALDNRPTAVYDRANDKIHVLLEATGMVQYKRFSIKRDSLYNITNIVVDTTVSTMNLEGLGGCSVSEGGTYPMLLWKDNGANGILVAFWEVKKTCSSTTVFETRASMRTLSNTSADGTASNWVALNGAGDNGTGPAIVPYNTLYTYTGTPSSGRKFTQSAFIRGGSGAKSEDIYYFNLDQNETFGFTRLGWNGISNNWSGTWTSRVTFGGDVNGAGYSANDELVTKPVYDSNLNRVYIGIARYLSGGSGDTQSLFYVNSSDAISSGVDIYSAGGAAWFAPTMDIMYNSDDQKVYVFYQTSSVDPTNSSNTNSSFEGNAWYRTYDGTTLGTPQAFLSQQIGGVTYTVDIPIVYQAPDNNRIILFFRGDGPETPFVPPHYIFFGYLSSGGAATTPSPTPLSSNTYNASTYTDFYQSCTVHTNSEVTKIADGEVALAASFRDDFELPLAPYVDLFSNKWSYDTWGGGSYTPQLTGTLLVYSGNGAYILGGTAFTNKIVEFRAKFTNHNFQHIGWTDGTGFGKFVMFSTANTGELNTRTYDGSGQTMNGLGTSYYGSYHTYKVDWGASSVRYYIDNVLVDTVTTNIPSGSLYPIASNNTTTAGSDLAVDWLQVPTYTSTSGTYQTCSINSDIADASWNAITFTATTSGSTSYTIKARTSNDNSTWSGWSSALSSGGNLTSAVGKFVQFLISFTGTSSETPTFNSLALVVASPTPTPTNTPTPTQTPTPTSIPTPTTAASSSQASTSGSSSEQKGPSSEPVAETSHIFVTGIGSLQTLFISSADSATIPKEPVKTDKRKPSIKGIAKAGTYVVIVLKELGLEHRMKADDTSFFSWTPETNLEFGTYTLSLRVEDNGKVRRLPDFQIQITKPFATFKVSEVNTVSEKPNKEKLDTESTETSNTTPTPSITGTRASATKDVTVEVKDTEGKPVANSEVILYSQPKKAMTDNKGQAHFKNIATGTHTLVVNYGASTGTQKITVSDDPSVKIVELKVVVEPKQSIPMNVFIITVVVLLGIILGLIYKNNLRRRHA